jgi:cytochrome c-type biogenesis protein CcmH/NrfG
MLVRALTSYRDAVAERVRGGEPFGAVEDAIDEVADLTQNEKAALWLYAFSLRPPVQQQHYARAHLASLC